MKKLEELPASSSEVEKFSKKMLEKEEWRFSQHINAFVGAGKKYESIISQTNGNWVKASAATGIQLICDNVHESGTVLAGYLYLNGYPEAQKMLLHYLIGAAEEVEVNTAQVFAEDEGVRAVVYTAIQRALLHKKSFGSVNVLQPDYKENKWRNAFGRINVPWVVKGGKIELYIDDKYAWHPLENRGTQCMHQAMDKASQFGAKPFAYHGTKMTIDLGELMKCKKDDFIGIQ